MDYSQIESMDAARALLASGQLTQLYLMPLEYGGMDGPMNMVLAPPVAKRQKESFDQQVGTLLAQGLELGYSAQPEYKGRSVIPSKLILEVSGDRTITEVIDIW